MEESKLSTVEVYVIKGKNYLIKDFPTDEIKLYTVEVYVTKGKKKKKKTEFIGNIDLTEDQLNSSIFKATQDFCNVQDDEIKIATITYVPKLSVEYGLK